MFTQVIGLIVLGLCVLVGLWSAGRCARALARRLARALQLHRRQGEMRQAREWTRARLLPSGPRQDIVRMRSDLLREMNHTQRVLDELVMASEILSGPALQLRAGCAQLDRRLKLLTREPSTDYLAELVPTLQARVARLRQDALLLRRSVLELDEIGAMDTDRAQQELGEHLAGLRAGVDAVRALTTPASHISTDLIRAAPPSTTRSRTSPQAPCKITTSATPVAHHGPTHRVF